MLGIKDNKEILGVESESIDKMLKDFTTSINNANKLYPPLYLLPEVYEIELGIKIIYIRVPEGGQVRRHNGIIWDRTYEGDIDITRNEEEILRSSGLILTDMETYKEGITLAAILLFGKDSSIMLVLPQFKTDAIYRIENIDCYDDRDY